MHERVDTAGSELLAGVRVERAVPLFSDRLGLTGKSDVVEFLADGTPYPVEYKHGPRRKRSHDDLQLAAQALCLEEMTGRPVPEGAIFHATSKRRRNVEISASLRADVKAAIGAVRTMLGSAALPAPVNDERCRHCSLHQRCQPEAVAWRARRDVLFSELFSTPDTPETDS